jgi:hypothetical protein
MKKLRTQALDLQTARRLQRPAILLPMLLVLSAVCPAYCTDLFVRPDGNDANNGSIDEPFKTIGKAHEQAQAGDNIFLRGGLNTYSQTIQITKSGREGNLITLQSYQDEDVVLDFNDAGDDERGIELSGSYWHLKGFGIQNAGDNGLSVFGPGSHNIFERLVTRMNGDSGLQLHTGASYNIVLNCDSYLNYDPENHGENADGFAAKSGITSGIGPGNTFVGCRAWSNSDDGWDFYHANNGVTVENCWAFNNGENIWGDPSFAGDGNGFKLGIGSGGHTLSRCVAYDNVHHGIDVNGNSTGVTVYNCTCAANQNRNFHFDEPNDAHVLRNNISYRGSVLIYTEIDDEYNSWNGFTVGDADFASLDAEGIDGQRKPDGGLPGLSFLRFSTQSSLIDAGINVGLTFEGNAPEAGAFEHLDGDCEPDGDIDLDDLKCLVSNWLNADCGDCNGADFDSNGEINLHDPAKTGANRLT